MRRIVTCIMLGTICAFGARGQQQKPKLSAPTLHYMAVAKESDKAPVADYVYKIIDGRRYISAMVKMRPGATADALDALGVKVGTRAGSIWTTQVPLDKVKDFTRHSAIEYIELDRPIFPTLDTARRHTRADSAQRGIYLPMGYSGKGVVAGIIDAGFDYTHPTFYDTTGAQYRVKRVWAQKSTSGTPPTGYAYGREMTDTNEMKTIGYDTAITSHGTHVAGITAGSGVDGGTGTRFRGFAYQSDLVFVGIMPSPLQWINTGVSDVVDGMNYIYTYANSVGKPCVVNLSWGSTLGPHDGSSLFSQACDFLTGPGRIFVCAAGNNGQDTVHLQKQFTGADTLVHTFVNFSPALDSAHKMTYVDLWGEPGQQFCVGARLFSGATAIDSTGLICMSTDTTYQLRLVGSNGDTCFATVTTIPVDFNGRPHTFIFFHSRVPDAVCLTTMGYTGTKVNMWEGYVMPPTGYYGSLTSHGFAWATNGDVEMTVSDIGSTRSALTVAAYATKLSFKNEAGETWGFSGTKGKLAAFSSHGPTLDNRVKPDIAAPGFGVVSSGSSFDPELVAGTGSEYTNVIKTYVHGGRTYPYVIFAGTSMASPCASGIVAMLLQQSPMLTPDSVKSILYATAIRDTFTSLTLPLTGNNTWGHGKINAYRALRTMVGNLAVATRGMDIMDCTLYPNPNHGTFTLSYTGKTQQDLDICVYDLTGRMVACRAWTVQPGNNHKDLDLTHLPAGTYLTKVSTATGYTTIKTVIE